MKDTELDHRARDRKQNLLMHMMHAMLVHRICFLFQRNFRVLFANFGNIKHFITYGNISSNNIREKKYSIVNHIQEKRKIIILWIPRNNHLKLGTQEDKMHEASSPPSRKLPPYLPSLWRVDRTSFSKTWKIEEV